jgi:solute carrier family 35, member E3
MILPVYRTAFYLALNAFSSIAIVYTNKVVFKYQGFQYGTLLTVIHFAITTLGLLICRLAGVFEPKKIEIVKILPLCLSFCGFVALTNMSLVYNTIGFYQLIKVLTTPLLVIIQTLFYHKTFSTKVKLSLTITCIGVAIATGSDSQANLFGTFVALSALLVTCMYQIWVGTKQSELQCNSFQLLYYQAPISCLMLTPIAYFSDNLAETYYTPCFETVCWIIFSGILAFLVNISIFLVIGKTSPVTYNVLGHFKLCVILSLGFLAFGDNINLRVLAGIVCTLIGVFWYTNLKMEESAKAKEETEKAELKTVEVANENGGGDEKGV